MYMGGKTLPGLAAHFIEAGMPADMPAVAVEDASLETQKIIRGTIASLPGHVAAASPRGPVLVLIGPAMQDDEGLAAYVAAAGA